MSTTVSPPHSGTRPGEPAPRVRAARPDLHPDTSAFRAAVVLLAGPLYACNIDRIAGRCGLPRDLVAASVRRLIDNGVWAAGTAVYPWSGPDDPRFWNDAAVAEGRLLRRTRPDGQVEWAPAGSWDKAFDYVGPQGDPGGAVLYLDAPPAPAADAEGAEAEGADAAEAAAAPGLPAESTPRPRVERAVPYAAARVPALRMAGGWLGAPAAEPLAGVAAAGTPRLPELFPGADWLA